MRVFVTGATGYVGFAVATALRRAGHDVYGLTRGAAKASQLARQEIHPVQGDIGDPKSYADAAEECSVLVHAAFESSASAVAKDKSAIDALIEAGRRGAQPKTLISRAASGCTATPAASWWTSRLPSIPSSWSPGDRARADWSCTRRPCAGW